jgi:hypothetical protein
MVAAKVLAISRRLHLEELVEAWRAGGNDILRRDAMEVDGFTTLNLVPHEHAIGYHLEGALVREVVPAVDEEATGNVQLPRRLYDPGLRCRVEH